MNGPSKELMEQDPVIRECLPELLEACDSEWLDEFEDPTRRSFSSEAQRAALELARSVGMCRILDIAVPDDLRGEMPAPMAASVAERFKEGIIKLINDAERLRSINQDGSKLEVHFNFCEYLVDDRFSCLAILRAISDAWISAADNNVPMANQLKTHLGTIQDFLDELDNTMEQNAAWFWPLADSYYFHNWRYRWEQCTDDPLPPWIIGSLEPAPPRSSRPALAKPFSLRSDQLAKRSLVDGAAAGGKQRQFRQFIWQKPGGDSIAELVVPKQILDATDELCTMRFRRNDEPDTTVSRVSLAGLPEKSADENAEIAFTMAELESARGEMKLVVDAVEWPLMNVFGDD